jgi:hypothetical protein
VPHAESPTSLRLAGCRGDVAAFDLTIEEVVDALHLSPDTVKPDWRFARLWLLRALSAEQPNASRA